MLFKMLFFIEFDQCNWLMPGNVMQVFHWRPTLRLYIIVRSAAKVGGVGDKNPQKKAEIGSASTPRQDVKHTGLSGS